MQSCQEKFLRWKNMLFEFNNLSVGRKPIVVFFDSQVQLLLKLFLKKTVWTIWTYPILVGATVIRFLFVRILCPQFSFQGETSLTNRNNVHRSKSWRNDRTIETIELSISRMHGIKHKNKSRPNTQYRCWILSHNKLPKIKAIIEIINLFYFYNYARLYYDYFFLYKCYCFQSG